MSKLDRRTVLRGVLGGAAVSVGLPVLDCFLNDNGTAFAGGGGLPKRFGIWFWGNGNLPERWVPFEEGRGWTPSEQLAPLATIQDDITVVTGMDVKTGNSIPHWSGPAGLLSGAPLIVRSGEDYTFSAPSLDQIVAAEVGGETRFKSLELGVKPDFGLSYNGPDSRNPPEAEPARLFDRIFGGGFRAPGSDPTPDPRLRLRRSVLDAVVTEIGALSSRVGAADKQRLELHFDGIRGLEQRLARLELAPPDLAACERPERPADEFPRQDGRPPMPEIADAMNDVLAMALACDQTRVFSYVYTYPVNNVLFPEMPAGHHRLTHDEPGEQPLVNRIVISIMEQFARFVDRLRSVPEGDGTLLDHLVVLGTSDTSFGRTHALTEYPIILAGSACGALQMGLHFRTPPGDNASKLVLTLMQAMDLRVESFGVDDGRATATLGRSSGMKPRSFGAVWIAALLVQFACGADDGTAANDGETVVVQTLTFAREVEDGVVAGFDLDGITSMIADPRTCSKVDWTSPEGLSGVDNEFARILPVLDLVGEGALQGLVQNAVNEGRLLMMFEVERLDEGRVRVRVRRGEDVPLLGTDGLILPGQTLALHSTASDLGAAEGTVVDGRVQIGPFALNVPVVIFSQLYEVFLPEAYVQLELPTEAQGGLGHGVIGGGIPIEQLVTILQTASNFAQEFDQLFGDAVRESGDLVPDRSGLCTQTSVALTVDLVSAFVWAP